MPEVSEALALHGIDAAVCAHLRAAGVIIGPIDDITFQTNLFELNAGVEAAKVCDAGRDFAVVAPESTHEISAIISAIIPAREQRLGKGVAMVAQTGTALKSISDGVSGIAAQISEIPNSPKKQSSSISENNIAAKPSGQATQKTATLFKETSATRVARQHGTETLARESPHSNLIRLRRGCLLPKRRPPMLLSA